MRHAVRHAVRSRLPGLLAALVVAVGACTTAAPIASTPGAGPSGTTSSGTAASVAPSASAPVSASAPATASPTPDVAHPDTVTLALDWTPNTDHTGFYVAIAKGWYHDAAIDVKFIPYGTAAPETLMGSGQADCGISFQDSLTFAVAAGVRVRSVMAILQHDASAIAVLASSGITRPRQLDGKVYAGFGYPSEVPTLKAVIKADGGKGDFKVVTADSTAYQALYSHQADFTIPFTAWEGVEAKEKGIALRYFQFTDYGFPDFYQVVLACSDSWLAAHPDVARRFVGATVRGFQYAATNPDDAAAILIAQNPGIFDANKRLPLDSARYLAQGRYYVDASGNVGTQTLAQWTAYSKFLYDHGLLTDAAGKPLTSPPDYASLFTNEFLP
ncbi:MAG: ABC transporter substrate-binding protein [Chloroflexi bacterium]|nr:ABC transporter substrate-binding protein [Chloroflexota bacterium]